jgi:hypothetical protein
LNAVTKWENPIVEIDVYYSYQQILPLLDCFELPAVQFYAIWTIYHLCSKNRKRNIKIILEIFFYYFPILFHLKAKRYCVLLREINGYKTVKFIREKSEFDNSPSIISLCELTLDIFEKQYLNERIIISSEIGENYFENMSKDFKREDSYLIDSLILYKHRPNFVRKTLICLLKCIESNCEPRTDLIELILVLMKIHSKIIEIQVTATALLYVLIKEEFSEKIDPKLIEKVANASILILRSFPNHQQLQKNALLILSKDCLLQSESINRYNCIQLILNSLIKFNDSDLNRIAVEIYSIISSELSAIEKSDLCSQSNHIETLLKFDLHQNMTLLSSALFQLLPI